MPKMSANELVKAVIELCKMKDSPEQREAIISDLNSDAAVDAYVACVRESTPTHKALRISALVMGAASLLFEIL